MTIAVHISLGETPDDVRSEYNYQCFSRMALQEPGDHFIFIFDKPFAASLIGSKNITPVLLGPVLKNRLLKHYWYQFKLPRVLDRYRADVYVNQDKMACLRTGTAQMMIVEDLAFMDKSGGYNAGERRYLKKYFPLFLQKADQIGVMNESLGNRLREKYPALSEKISRLVPYISPGTNTENEHAQLNIEELTGGRSYFVFLVTGLTSMHTTLALKAFSIFKKWQKSNMQMLLLSTRAEKGFSVENLATYKYRDEVKIATPVDIPGWQTILSGAYATLYLPVADIPEQASLDCLSCGSPLICTDSPFHRSRYGEAALYSSLTESAIAEKMMRLYKDESLRTEIIHSGNRLAASSGVDQAVSALRHALLGKKGLTFAAQ